VLLVLIALSTYGVLLLLALSTGFCVFASFLLHAQRKAHTCKPTATEANTLLRLMPEGYVGMDEQAKIVEVNDAYLQMTGYTRKQLVGRQFKEIVVLAEGEDFDQRLQQIAYEKAEIFETTHRTHEGNLLSLEVSIIAVHAHPLAYICFYRDISKRRKAESALRHSTDLLRYVIEHTRSAIAIHDKNLRYLYVSQKYLDEYHIPDGKAIIGKHHYEVIPDLPEKWREVHQRALAGEVISADDDAYEKAEGKTEYTRWECRPWYEESGEVGGIIIYTELITKQKEFEVELRKAHDYLAALISHANAPILVWDRSYSITESNKAFADLLQLPLEEVVGKQLEAIFSFVPEEDIKEIFLQLEVNKELANKEMEIPNAQGPSRTVLWNAAAVSGSEDSSWFAIIAQGQDISERKKIERDNRQQLEELKRWFALMTQREDRILELKREVNLLLDELERPQKYESVQELEL
jgi:PAS domain S-box-containing protein